MSTFVETSPFLGSALCVAMEIMHFQIVEMGLFIRAIICTHLGCFIKTI